MRRPCVHAAIVAALAIAPYLGSFSYPLMGDDRTLAGSSWVQREVGVASAFTHDYWHGTRHEGSNLYRPLTVLSLAANARLAPSRAAFRGVNVALHVLAALAALWALRGLVPEIAAAIGAGLFAVHPLASEAVLLAVGRADTIAAAAGLAAFRLVLDGGARRIGGAAALFALALFAKESAATWLAILVLGALVLGRKEMWRGIAALGGVFVVWLLVRGSVVGWTNPTFPDVDNPLAPLDPVARVANAVVVLGGYAVDAIWPATLSLEHGFAQTVARPMSVAGPWALAIAAGWAAAAWGLTRRDRAAGFLALFPAAAFAVTANVLFPIGTVFAERLAYAPLVGACGLAGWALALLARPAWLPIALAGALAIAGGVRTHVRTADFRDLATLHAATAEASPRAIKALYNLARTRLRQGNAAEAVPLLERALALRPDYAAARALLDAARGAAARPGGDDEEP